MNITSFNEVLQRKPDVAPSQDISVPVLDKVSDLIEELKPDHRLEVEMQYQDFTNEYPASDFKPQLETIAEANSIDTQTLAEILIWNGQIGVHPITLSQKLMLYFAATLITEG